MQAGGVSLDLTLIMHEQAFGDYLTDHSFLSFESVGWRTGYVKPCFLWYFKIGQIFMYVKIKIKVDLFPCGPASLSFRKLKKNFFLAFESQFNIRMYSLRTCKTSFYTENYKELPLCII